MHDLSEELRALPADAAGSAAFAGAMRRESREVFSIRGELLVALYAAVAAVLAGVGLLVRAHLDRIGPFTLLAGLFAAAALCYGVALRAHRAGRARSLGEDYVLLLAALLFSAAVGYAEAQFHMFGAHWSRHLLLLCAWHLATAHLLGSRLVLSTALAAFAGWLGLEVSLGALIDARSPLLGAGQRALCCAAVFWLGSRLHGGRADAPQGFREVYLHFAANFGFWGALALGGDASMRWIGALVLAALAVVVGMQGWRERRESFLLYAVGYSTIGLIWLASLVLPRELASWFGLMAVCGAVAVLVTLRSRLRESGE